MQCPRCQAENRQGRRFCAECGASLASPCPSCGFSNEPGEKFCGGCGLSLASPRPGFEPQSSPARPYTPSYLAEKILTSKSALEGERKQVTVLFADLKGSMELLADRDPEESRTLLDPVLDRMIEAVHRYEGTVNQVMGDGIMALFGAPIAHEDHAVRACYAALRMQEAIGRYAEALRRAQGVDVQIRAGLNSGEVVVRSIGSDLHMDYTAVGQTTHLAARMEQLARPGTTLLTAATLRLVEGYVEVNTLGPVPVKGLQEPIEVYELRRAGPVRSRLQAAAARGLTCFVGRGPELEQLQQALARAVAGHGQVVAGIGEPGVGKSRLIYEFTRSHRTHGWLLLESHSVSYGKATPYLPLIDLLKTYFGVEVRDDVRKIREKVTGKLLALDRTLEPTLPALLTLLEVPIDERTWQALDPQQRRQRLLEAIKRLLLRESQVQSLLLVCEDLHWVDAETQALLDSLVESLPTARLLLLVNYRPEYQHSWGSKTYYTQLRLDPLPPESAEALLRGLLGEDTSLALLKRVLIERTQGNPFFLEETVWTLVETQALLGERGAYRLAPHAGAALHGRPRSGNHRASPLSHGIQLPATVQAVLAARIDRLPPEEKRVLQTAAVIGTEVPWPLLQAIAEVPDEELHRGLAHLQAAEFLYETSLYPELEYTFKHALTHEVAYGGLLQERRRTLHARIVEASEALYRDRLADQIERLAHHAWHGDVWEKAVVYCWQAGAKAHGRSANREAMGYFEQALVALEHLPESRERHEQAIDLRRDLIRVLTALGEFERMSDHLHAAEALAQALGDRLRLGWVSVLMTDYLYLMNDRDCAIAFGQRAMALASELGNIGLHAAANLHMGRLFFTEGDYDQAMAVPRQNQDILQGELRYERFGGGVTSVISCNLLSRCQAERGAFREGHTTAADGLRVAEEVDHLFSLIVACSAAGHLHLRQGNVRQAIPVLERAVELCRVWHIPLQFPLAASDLGLAYALCGRLTEGIPLAEHAVSMLRRGTYMALWVASLGEVYLLAGRLEDAHARAVQALERSRTYKERGHQAWALRLLGEILAQCDPPEVEPAEASYCEALALADELGMRPLVAHCHHGLGMLYHKIGRFPEAHAELGTAIELYRPMEMAFWLARAEAELAKTSRGQPCPLIPSPLWGEGQGEGEVIRTPQDSTPRHRARRLRRDQTQAERRLWAHLRDRRLNGAKFRRQHSIGPFIADFCCPERGLVVELDGGQHASREEADRRRTAFLMQRGYRVLRFWDNEVMENIEAVLQRIAEALSHPHPNPLPGREREQKGLGPGRGRG
jgi:class 3 adenylate cyclase/very-short-patch-repair endonuclease/tetratricopeptide (TPR) repeat protein